jgi:sterol desaturase/sphingolipid hydroxylase (fatty acid hydroxylase superfamily)
LACRPRALDLLFFVGQFLVWNGLALWVLSSIHEAWRGVAPFSLGTWPWPVQLALALVVGELAVYWLHRAFHRIPWLWRIHAVHHSSTELDWLAAYREHPLDGLLVQLAMNLPSILLGLSLSAFAPVILFRGLWAIVVHSNIRIPLGPLANLIGAPHLHRYHHAATPARVCNFANLSPWIDRLFGTHGTAPEEGYALGNAETDSGVAEHPVTSYVRHLALQPKALPLSWWGYGSPRDAPSRSGR